MKYLFAISWLSLNFLKSVIQSGFATAKMILFMPKTLQSGITQMDYHDLDGMPLVLLGMIITLTPGTTLIDIDRQKKSMTLHLLDLTAKEAIFRQVDQDFVSHLKVFSREVK